MKTAANVFLVLVLALAAMVAVGQRFLPAPDGAVVITTTDGGAATREKYLSAYRAELRKAARDFAVRVRAEEFKDSLSAVKAWSEMAKAAGKEASRGVDARVAELCKAESLEEQVAWIEDFAR
jgi:hypothetical protein